jgi:hypothetical protein
VVVSYLGGSGRKNMGPRTGEDKARSYLKTKLKAKVLGAWLKW